MKPAEQNQPHETVIAPSRHFFYFPMREIAAYRDLLFQLVRRDFVSKYKQTVLGPAWFMLQPLLTTLVFTVVFGNFAEIPTDRIPPLLFYLCGLLAWDYFAQSASGTAMTMLGNVHLFSKIYFPRLIMPLSVVLSNLMRYALQLCMFLGFYVYFKFHTNAGMYFHPSPWLFLLPLVLAMTIFISLGIGLCVSALTVRYRDLQHLVGFVLQLWMYATPVIYPLALVPDRWKWLALLNPMTQVVEFYRMAFFGAGTLSAVGLLICATATTVIFSAGLYLFNKAQRTFIDII
jgi:lipopolysaccharide transport system permease protein